MTDNEARLIALRSINRVIGVVAGATHGMEFDWESNRYLSTADKQKIRRRMWEYQQQLHTREHKLDIKVQHELSL